MNDKRGSLRHRVLKAGSIDLGGGAIDCSVRNLSDKGAALEVVSQAGIPERFALVIAGDGLHRRCRAVWRSGRRIGVAFEPDDPSGSQG
ncbi:PilZ domain-containing protein [Bradyrhizobium sp.]|uniref:PilZ domain-containing protein n=1 Tax=Bradyrhizobium sp. TaxID=376 RepID=UPI004037EE19